MSDVKLIGILISDDPVLGQTLAELLAPIAALHVSGNASFSGAPETVSFVLATSSAVVDGGVLHDLRKSYPGIPIILLIKHATDVHFHLLQQHAIRHLLSLEHPYFQSDLVSAILAATSCSAAFNISSYLPDASSEQVLVSCAASETERNDLRTLLTKHFSHILPQERVSEVQLCFDELLNNCFYHAFRDKVGVEKYDPASFICLLDGDSVELEVATDGVSTAILSMTDNAGSLIPGRVMTVLARQASREGIFDERGRGFFLMRSFSQRMVVSIEPGVRTRVTLVFRTNMAGWKPLEINCFYQP